MSDREDILFLLAEIERLKAERDAAAKAHTGDGPTDETIETYQSAVHDWRTLNVDTSATTAGAMLHDLKWLRGLRYNALRDLAEVTAENIRLRARVTELETDLEEERSVY